MALRSDLSLQAKSPAKAQSIPGKGTYISPIRPLSCSRVAHLLTSVIELHYLDFVSPLSIKRIFVEIIEPYLLILVQYSSIDILNKNTIKRNKYERCYIM